MKTWMKIAAGLIGGIAIVASLGGFGGKKTTTTNQLPEPEISDDIFDGNRQSSPQKRNSESIRAKNEQNIRNLQEGLTKASNVLGHISIICNSVVKMFYEDPCIRVTPTTFII